MSLIRHVECTSAEEFLDKLSPGHRGVFGGREYYEWAFRGHAIDDQYKLLPQSLRSPGKLNEYNSPPILTNGHQIAAERDVLLRFATLIDKNGLPLPDDSRRFRDDLYRFSAPDFLQSIEANPTNWIPSDLWSVAALAQHYGLPTRLLDWSWSHLAAAYFAAVESARILKRPDPNDPKLTSSSQLSVWAFSPPAFDLVATQFFRSRKIHSPVQIVGVPRASNQNLHAQHGLFTMPIPQINFRDPVDRRPMDELLQPYDEFGPLLWHFTLPVAEAGRLLYQLSQEGVDAAALFPGYDGIARSMKEPGYWFRGPR